MGHVVSSSSMDEKPVHNIGECVVLYNPATHSVVQVHSVDVLVTKVPTCGIWMRNIRSDVLKQVCTYHVAKIGGAGSLLTAGIEAAVLTRL